MLGNTVLVQGNPSKVGAAFTAQKSRPQTSASMRSSGLHPKHILDWLTEELEYTWSLRNRPENLSIKPVNEGTLKPLCSATNKEFMTFLVDRVKQARHVAAFREYMSIDKNSTAQYSSGGRHCESNFVSSSLAGELYTMRQLKSEQQELQKQLDEYRALCQAENAKHAHLLEKHDAAIRQLDVIKNENILIQRNLALKRSLLQKQGKYLEQLKLLQSKLSIHASHSSSGKPVHSGQSGKLSMADTIKIIVKLLDDCQNIDDIKKETENIDWSSVQVPAIRQFIEKSSVKSNIEIHRIHEYILSRSETADNDIFEQQSTGLRVTADNKVDAHLHKLRRKFVRDHEALAALTSENHKLEASSKANLHRLKLLIRSKYAGDDGAKICSFYEAYLGKESSRALLEHMRMKLHNLTIMKHDFLAEYKNLSQAVESSKRQQDEVEKELVEKSNTIKKLINVQHVMSQLSTENLKFVLSSTGKIETTINQISDIADSSKDLLAQNLNVFNSCFTSRFGSCKLSEGTDGFVSDLSVNKRSFFDNILNAHQSIDSLFFDLFDQKFQVFYDDWIKQSYDSAKVQFDTETKSLLSSIASKLGRENFKSVRMLLNWLRESNSMTNSRFSNEEVSKLQDILDIAHESETIIQEIEKLCGSSNDIFNLLQYAQSS